MQNEDVESLTAHVWHYPGRIEQADLAEAARCLRQTAEVVSQRIWGDPAAESVLFQAFLDDIAVMTPNEDADALPGLCRWLCNR